MSGVDAFVVRNQLLARMSGEDRALIAREFEPVELPFRERLERPDQRIRHAYFLERGLASVITASAGEQSEVAVIGCEGMVGFSLVLGVDRTSTETLMQVEGAAQRIAAAPLIAALAQSASLTSLLLRYVYVLYMQTAYTAHANAQGTINARLARWLLMAHDRLNGDELHLTHEFLSIMLGVRRAGVTAALNQLAEERVIATARGHIAVLDRVGLEKSARGLYGAAEAEFDRWVRRNGN